MQTYYEVQADYDSNGQWGTEYGSFDRSEAKQEAKDIKESYGCPVRVIKTKAEC